MKQGRRDALRARGGARGKLRSAVETGVLTALILSAAASAIAGTPVLLFCVVVSAWLALTAIVGPRNALDAGCAFMLLVVGIILVVDLVANGPVTLLP